MKDLTTLLGVYNVQIYNGTPNKVELDQQYYKIPSPQGAAAKGIQDILASINYSYRHDSDARFPYPKCSDATREEILKEILLWARSNMLRKIPGVFWLRGSAGVGKSAIAQTVAQTCEGKELLASFFFSRADPNRNNPRYLVLAIAHGISAAIPSLRHTILQLVRVRPEILQASLEAQFKALIVEPLQTWASRVRDTLSPSRVIQAASTLIVIDGLNECLAFNDQQCVLSLVLWAMKEKLPLRFLICSRPEPQIREGFNQEALRQFTRFISLHADPDVYRDIELMLRDEFSKIRNSERCRQMVFPDPWPNQADMETLLEKSSGQFIYPMTVVKFVGIEDSHPCDQLNIVLGLPPARDSLETNPYADLDVLYRQILSTGAKDREKLAQLIAFILLLRDVKSATPYIIERILELRPGEVLLTLQKMHSVLHIEGTDDEITVYHASFIDFLSDPSRSGPFFIDTDLYHEDLVCRWLRLLGELAVDGTTTRDHPGLAAIWRYWGTFCRSLKQPSEKVFIALRTANLRRVFNKILQAMWCVRCDCTRDSHLTKVGFSEFRGIVLWLKAITLSPADLKHLQSIKFSVECKNTVFDDSIITFFRRWMVVQFFGRGACMDLHMYFLHLLDAAEVALGSLLDILAPDDLEVVDPEDDNCACAHNSEEKSITCCATQPSILHVDLNGCIADSLLENIQESSSHHHDPNHLQRLSKTLRMVLFWCPQDHRLLEHASLMSASGFADIEVNQSTETAPALARWLKKFPSKYSEHTRPHIDRWCNEDWPESSEFV